MENEDPESDEEFTQKLHLLQINDPKVANQALLCAILNLPKSFLLLFMNHKSKINEFEKCAQYLGCQNVQELKEIISSNNPGKNWVYSKNTFHNQWNVYILSIWVWFWGTHEQYLHNS